MDDWIELSRPDALWALLGLPVIVLLALPPRPRRTLFSAHLVQWDRALHRLGRRPVRFRWRRLALLLLAFAAAVAAAAGPRGRPTPGPRALAIVLDASASMAAGAGRDTAIARAAAAIERGLAGVPAEVPVRMAICDARVAVAELPREPDALRAALAAVRPAGGAGVDLAGVAGRLAVLGDPAAPAVWTVTDGFGRRAAAAAAVAGGALTIVGEPAANTAVLGVTVDDPWPLPDVRVRLELAHFGGRPRTVELAVSWPGAPSPVPPQRIELPAAAGEPATRVVELELRRVAGGWARFAIAAGDALALDDAVEVFVPPPPAPDIAVAVGEEDSVWLHAAARVLADESAGRVVDAAAVERAGFLLADGGTLAERAGRSLTFGTAFGRPAGAADVVEAPAVVDQDRADPLLRGLDLSELRVRRALRATLLPPGRPLLVGDRGPLLVVVDGERPSLHAAFRLGDSNLPLLAAFPQLLRRAYGAAFGRLGPPPAAAGNLCDPAESDLRAPVDAPGRPLPAFGRDGADWTVPLLVLAAFAVALRAWA